MLTSLSRWPAPHDLAGLIAQLASVSSRLETAARADARAREQATLELVQYEAVLAERQEAERAQAGRGQAVAPRRRPVSGVR